MDLKTAALLNPNDPERLRVEQETCQTDEGRKAWLEATREAEQLRVDLRNSPATPDAVTRALQIPRPQKTARPIRRVILSAAAALLVTATGLVMFTQRQDTPRIVAAMADSQEIRRIDLDPEIRQLSLLAMHNFHERDTALTSAQDVNTLLTALPGAANVPHHVPALAPLEQFVGGKIVPIHGHDALLTRWTESVNHGHDHDIVIQQLHARDLHLPPDMNPVLVKIEPPATTGQPACDVLVWSANGTVYMLVAKSSDGCARRALQALKQKIGSAYPAPATV